MRFYRLDEGFKGSSYLTETLLDPELGHAYESSKTAFNKAHNFEGEMWTWFEAPDNRLRLARFGAAMNGAKNITPADSILEGSASLRSIAPHVLTKYISNRQGMPGKISLRVRWLSMSAAALARSPCCLLSITHTSASLFRIVSPSWAMQYKYVRGIRLEYGICLT
jgi:hypothetical protein